MLFVAKLVIDMIEARMKMIKKRKKRSVNTQKTDNNHDPTEHSKANREENCDIQKMRS